MSWIIGAAVAPVSEYQIIRFGDYDSAAKGLTTLMAWAGPYDMDDMFKCIHFLTVLEDAKPEDYTDPDRLLTTLHLSNCSFVIGRYEALANDSEATYKIVQDHTECTDDFCFGDIAKRN